MIYSNKTTEDIAAFERLLKTTSGIVTKYLELSSDASKITPGDFEQLVFESSKEASKGTQFEGSLRRTDDREFPDIVDDNYFGIEVKATKKDAWTSIGNSVLESTRVQNIQKIYVFFGKLGGNAEVIFKNYEDCLKGIAVTHYPRYQIDMRLGSGQSIFEKMGTSYEVLRRENNPVKTIRAYYHKQLKEGQELWWVSDNLEDANYLSPIIKPYASLSAEEKNSIEVDLFIKFPEMLSKSTAKFINVAPYLVAAHGVISPNVRDIFTSGGRGEVKVGSELIVVPQIVCKLLALAPLISQSFTVNDGDINIWLNEIDKQSMYMQLTVHLSDMFRASTNNCNISSGILKRNG